MSLLSSQRIKPALYPFNLEEEEDTEVVKQLSFAKRYLTPANIVCGLVCLVYAILFYRDIAPFWFNIDWTTDDSLQQVVPFHLVYNREVFADDLIATTMKGYLAPLHYGLGYLITLVTRAPVMTAHWMMLVQVVLTVGFLFGAVKYRAGIAPAFLAVAWLLHTRPVMQRITCGLPRGWSAVVLAAFLYFVVRKNHKGVLATLLCGCLLHPPTTMIAAVAYGLYLSVGVFFKVSRAESLKPFLVLLLLSPLYAGVTFWVIDRPPEVGAMVSRQQAQEMPEFQRPAGRFPFLPLEPISYDVKMFGYNPFWHRLHNPGRPVKQAMPWIIVGLFCAIVLVGRARKTAAVPRELWCLLAAIVGVYLASRALAFKLYVPNRHLQFPMAFFLIATFTIGIWRALPGKVAPLIASALLGGLVWIGSGDGLQGSANFNFSRYKKGRAFQWVRKFTPPDALVAGHPTHIDSLPLFSIRRAYATTETAHPFYPTYYYEMKRRLEISLKAHYAKDLQELLALVEPEGIDYFIFSKKRFYPEALEKERYFSPLNVLVDELTSRYYMDYAYKQLPRQVDLANAPYLTFRDEHSAVVDIKALREHLYREVG